MKEIKILNIMILMLLLGQVFLKSEIDTLKKQLNEFKKKGDENDDR